MSMKKLILFLFVPILYCCSSSDSTNNNNSLSSNFITINSEKYYFDKAQIERSSLLSNSTHSIFIVSLYDTAQTHGLNFAVECRPSTQDLSPPNPIPFYIGNYSYNYNNEQNLRQATFATFINNQIQNTLFNEGDFVGTLSRVIVGKSDNLHYSFSINFITTLGVINGNYSGQVTKIGF